MLEKDRLTLADHLDLLAKGCYSMAASKGFWDIPEELNAIVLSTKTRLWIEQAVKAQKMALITTETSEQVEAIRKPDVPSALEGFTAEEEEAADQIIRIMDYCGRYQMRIGEAVVAKMAKNALRPQKHGKQF